MSKTISKHVYDCIFGHTADIVGAKTNRIAFVWWILQIWVNNGVMRCNVTCLDFSFNRNIRWHSYPSRCHAAPFQIVSFCDDQWVACQVLVHFGVKSITGGSVFVRDFVILTYFLTTKRRRRECKGMIGELEENLQQVN